MTKNLLHSLLQGPQAFVMAAADTVLSQTLLSTLMQKQIQKEEQLMSLNQWTCRDVKIEKPDKTTPPNFLNVKAGDKATVGSEEAKTYTFSVQDEQSQKEMPVTLYVSAASGLPLKIEMNQPEGSVTLEYYDVDAPMNIEIPDCMKKK